MCAYQKFRCCLLMTVKHLMVHAVAIETHSLIVEGRSFDICIDGRDRI